MAQLTTIIVGIEDQMLDLQDETLELQNMTVDLENKMTGFYNVTLQMQNRNSKLQNEITGLAKTVGLHNKRLISLKKNNLPLNDDVLSSREL